MTRLAACQKKYGLVILIIFAVVTIFLGFGITRMELESDFTKLMPQDLPIVELNDKITQTFGGQDTVFVLFQLDEESGTKGLPDDIRHPFIMQYIFYLDTLLKQESQVQSVVSVAPAVADAYAFSPFLTEDLLKMTLSNDPASSSLISRDYKTTMMIIKADIGGSDAQVEALTKNIDEKIGSIMTPPGVKITITGSPSIRMAIVSLLKRDAVFTLLIASIIILALLMLIQRSFTEAVVIFTPIMLGISWTIGTMGWLGIKLSIVTAGLGAMLLGLGVEYGVFMSTRYREERGKGLTQEQALQSSVPGVGSAILGSGTTTIVGFLALSFSMMPMLQTLGQSLALGIFFSIIAAVVVEPVMLVFQENRSYRHALRTRDKMSEKVKAQKRSPR